MTKEISVGDVEFYGRSMKLFLTKPFPQGALGVRLSWRFVSDSKFYILETNLTATDFFASTKNRLGAEDSQFACVDFPKNNSALSALTLSSLDEHLLRIDVELEKNLACLLPANDEEYGKLFRRGLNRWGSARNIYFIADQIYDNFSGGLADRVGAAIVKGYKSMEVSDPTAIISAQNSIRDALTYVRKIPVDFAPRRNGQHLEISLLSVLWQIEIYQGNVLGAISLLENMMENSFTYENYFTLGYNLNRSISFLGFLQYKIGNYEKAAAAWNFSVEIFMRSVRDSSSRNPTLFRDLGDIHNCAFISCTALHLLRNNILVDERLPLEKMASACFRVDAASRLSMCENIRSFFGVNSH